MKKIHLLCLVMAISALPILSNGNDSLSLNADFVQEFENKTHYIDEAEEFAKEICDEGFVLLKNSNNYLPLQKNLKISVFGKNSYSFIRGGAGRSTPFTVAGCKEENIYSSLRNAGFTINPELVNFYKDDSKSGAFRSNGNSSFTSISEITIGETPVSSYDDNLKDSFKNYKDAAVFVICREGTEGADVPTIDSSDEKKYSYSEKHGLELSNNEEDLLNLIEENFDNVIVVINSSNIFECAKLENDNKVKGIIWIGMPGGIGVDSLGRILNGQVNPSGRTVDTWTRDFTKDPTFQNFGDNRQNGKAIPDTKEKLKHVSMDTMFNPDGTPVKSMGTYRHDPTWLDEENKIVNRGLNGAKPSGFVEYEEDIYLDYRYYETRYADMALTNKTEADNWYKSDEGVIFPFGYGLSYTTFKQEIMNVSPSKNSILTESTKQIALKVKVTNTGNVAGKEVVQAYWKAPYVRTISSIEKADHILCAFEKTGLLNPGESECVTLTFDLQDVANYDYKDMNHNGYCCYELDGGNYSLGIYKNAHEMIEELNYSIESSGICYTKDKITKNEVKNRFSNKDYFDTLPGNKDVAMTLMSRANFTGSFPKFPSIEDRTLKEGSKVPEYLNHEFRNSELYEEKDFTYLPQEAIKTKQDAINGGWSQRKEALTNIDERTQLSDFSGLSIDDPKWDSLLNEFTYEELENVVLKGSMGSGSFDAIGFKSLLEGDGSQQFSIIWWPCPATIAATFNKDIAHRQGELIAEEAKFNEKAGWWGPFAEVRRSPFGGRNYEMFSSDPYLTGKMCASLVKAASDKGVYVYAKNLALENQEQNREGGVVYLSEQALREIYLKPYQIVVQEGDVDAILVSYFRLGLVDTSANYRLLNDVVRNEWGFKGLLRSDMLHTGSSYVNLRCYYNLNYRFLAGLNSILDSNNISGLDAHWSDTAFDGKGAPVVTSNSVDYEDYTWWNAMRESAKQRMYLAANSCVFINKYSYINDYISFESIENKTYTVEEGSLFSLSIDIGSLDDYSYDYHESFTKGVLRLNSTCNLPDTVILNGNTLSGKIKEAGKYRVSVILDLYEGDEIKKQLSQEFKINVTLPDDIDDTIGHKANSLIIVGCTVGGVLFAGAMILIFVFKKRKI